MPPVLLDLNTAKILMLNYNSPIRIFLSNLYRIGITLRVVDDKLRIGGAGRATLSPVYRAEIVRRAPQLIELLSPPVPEPLKPYAGRLLSVYEMEDATKVAAEIGANITPFPANGGWVLLMRSW